MEILWDFSVVKSTHLQMFLPHTVSTEHFIRGTFLSPMNGNLVWFQVDTLVQWKI